MHWFPPPMWGRVRVGGEPAGASTPTLTLPRRGGGNQSPSRITDGADGGEEG
jgi:hypothetical protein